MQPNPNPLAHPFERAGLGKAPFRVVGADYRVGPIRTVQNGVEIQIGAPGQPMGSCAYCAMGIALCFTIMGADGSTFIVGSDCVEKVAAACADSRLGRSLREKRAEANRVREEAQLEQARLLLERDDIRAELRAEAHPIEWARRRGMTLLDSVEFQITRCGRKARRNAACIVRRFAERIEAAR